MKTLLISILALVWGMTASAQTAATAPVQATQGKSVVRNVTVEQFDTLRRGTNTVVLDVRTQAEFAEGHLDGAVLLDYRAADFAEKVAKLDKSKQYLVHCAAGGRSARACAKMETLGFTNLVNLEGGLGAWTDAGKPVVK
jgi:rhodanese-related sulfurtransferase